MTALIALTAKRKQADWLKGHAMKDSENTAKIKARGEKDARDRRPVVD